MTHPDLHHSRHASNRRWSRVYCRDCKQPLVVRQHRAQDRVEFECKRCDWSWQGGRRFWLNKLRQFTAGLWLSRARVENGQTVHEAEPVAGDQVQRR